MNRTLFLMQGIPGSGKSTMAKVIADKYEAIIFSTDDFWITRIGDQVIYSWNREKLGEAHRWNQRRCVQEMMSDDGGNIVIDNTNIKKRDAQVYFDLASMFNYDIQVVRVEVPVDVAIARQESRPEDRRIPNHVIRNMQDTMEKLI